MADEATAEEPLSPKAERAAPQLTAALRREYEQEGPFLRYSGGTVLPKGQELQAFLNTFPDVELQEDGKLGPRSSDAFRRVTGHRLFGDPR